MGMKIRNMLLRALYGNQIPHYIMVYDSFAIEIKFIAENDNGIEFEFQCEINH